MVKSLNTKVDLVINGTVFTWISDYGKIMVGDIRKYVDSNHIVRSLSFFDVLKRGVGSMFKKK